jgi:hypothetical protein
MATQQSTFKVSRLDTGTIRQCDQIVRIFVHWAIVYLGLVKKNKSGQLLSGWAKLENDKIVKNVKSRVHIKL